MLISLQSDLKKRIRLSLIIDLANDSIGSSECRDSTNKYPVIPWWALFRYRPMSVPGLSLLGLQHIRGFVSILRSINPTIITIITSAKVVIFPSGFVCPSVCLFICEQDNSKTYGQILIKFSGYVRNGKRKK